MITFLNLDQIKTIPQECLPLLFLTDNLYSLLATQIHSHDEGQYSHCGWQIKQNFYASQEWTYRQTPIEQYADGKHRIKLFIGNWTKIQREMIISQVRAKLALPWWRRVYDPLSIVGHATGHPEIQIPFLYNCSEITGKILGSVEKGFKEKYSTPNSINVWAKKNLVPFGFYDPDLEQKGMMGGLKYY